MVAKFSTIWISGRGSFGNGESWSGGETNRGRMRCVAVKMAPRRMQTPPTAMYAIPKKLLRPPMTVRVVRTTDLVPLYSMVGKSAKYMLARYWSRVGGGTLFVWVRHTIIDSDLVDTRIQLVGVIAHSQLAKCRQSGCAHPNLEVFPLLQVWWLVHGITVFVAIWIGKFPVRWRLNLRAVILGRPIEIFVAVPRDTSSRHVVRTSLAVIGRVLPDGRRKAVVEHGVGDKTTRVIRLIHAIGVVAIKRCTF